MSSTSKVAYSNEAVDYAGQKYKDVSDDITFSVNASTEINTTCWRTVMKRRQDLSEAVTRAIAQKDQLRHALQKNHIETKLIKMKVTNQDFDPNKIGQSRAHFTDLLDEVHKIFAQLKTKVREITALGVELVDDNVRVITEPEDMLQVDSNEIVKTVKALNQIMQELGANFWVESVRKTIHEIRKESGDWQHTLQTIADELKKSRITEVDSDGAAVVKKLVTLDDKLKLKFKCQTEEIPRRIENLLDEVDREKRAQLAVGAELTMLKSVVDTLAGKCGVATINYIEGKLKNQETSISTLQKQFDDSCQQVGDLTDDLLKHNKFKDIVTRFESVLLKSSLISGKIKSLQDEIEQLNKNIKHYIDESEIAHHDEDSSKAHLKTEQGKVLALESELTKILAELEDTQQELKTNIADMILKDVELANDKIKLQGCTTKLQDEENKYKEAMKQLAEMDYKYAKLDQAHREIQRQDRPVRTETAQLKDRVSILLDRLRELVPRLHGRDYLQRLTAIIDLISTVFDDVTEDDGRRQLLKMIVDSLYPR
jgi:chromosome segregation ATPase